ncbi:MAG: hypothetical protein ACXAB7_19240 [Candidatus Kariarchaeaceae archaeon]|jgi:hypothetical protein
MKLSLLLGSILFLLLPFTILSLQLTGDSRALTYNGFFYSYSEEPETHETEFYFFNTDMLGDAIGTSEPTYGDFFGNDYWWLGVIAIVLAVLALIGSVVEFHRLQGLLLVVAGVIVLVGRYLAFDGGNLSYPSDETEGITWTDLPIGVLIAVIFGILSLRSSD